MYIDYCISYVHRLLVKPNNGSNTIAILITWTGTSLTELIGVHVSMLFPFLFAVSRVN